MNARVLGATLGLAAMLLAPGGAAMAVNVETVPVGNPGNTADYTTYGSVAYAYAIGKYEVTNAQYREFLNAVATVGDPNGLYHYLMAGSRGGIARSGLGTSWDPFVYTAKGGDSNWDNRPVNYVSWYDALRFSNWLHNGQPVGVQDANTTEDGSYGMSLGASVVRKPGATWVLPTEDEWYKAAYHKNDGVTGNYWDYPTARDTLPVAEAPPGTYLVHGSANYYLNGYVDPTYYATPVGAYTAKPSDSAYHTFDQGGNLQEWHETLIGSSIFLRGGSFSSNLGICLYADARVIELLPTETNDRAGFRVSQVPEPGSAALLLATVVGLLARRRRR